MIDEPKGLIKPDEEAGEAQQSMGEEQGEAASPEEQAQYDAFVKNAMQVIYAKGKVAPAILQSLDGDGDPITGLANTAVAIVSKLVKSAESAGQEISSDVVLHAGAEILADLANVQKEAGIADLSDDEQEQAFYKAVDAYRDLEQKSGTLDQAGLEDDFTELMAANEEGRIDDVVPGASKAAERFAQRGATDSTGAAPASGSPAAPQ